MRRGIAAIFGAVIALSAGSASAARYWVTGGAGCNAGAQYIWSNTSCWSATSGGATGASVPDTTQDVTFDSNGNNACTINVVASVKSITTQTGFTSLITISNTASNPDLTVTNDFNMTAGKADLTLSNSQVTVGGAFTINGQGTTFNVGSSRLAVTGNTNIGRTVDLSAATLSFAGSLTLSGQTVTLGGQTLTLTALTTAGGNLTMGTANITVTGAGDSTTIASTDTIDIRGATLHARGNMVVDGKVILGNGTLVVDGNYTESAIGNWTNSGPTASGTLTITGNASFSGTANNKNFSNLTALTLGGDVTENDGKTMTFPTGKVISPRSITISSGTFAANGATVNISQSLNISDNFSLQDGIVTVGTTFTMGATSSFNGGTASGSLAVMGDANIQVNGNVNMSGMTAFTVGGALTYNSAGNTLTLPQAPAALSPLSITVTAGTFNTNGATVHPSTFMTIGGTLTPKASAITVGTVFNFNAGAGFTANTATGSLAVGTDANILASMDLTNLTSFSVGSALTFNAAGGTLELRNTHNLTPVSITVTAGTLITNSATLHPSMFLRIDGTLTSTSSILNVGTTFTLSSTGTFTSGANGSLLVGGAAAVAANLPLSAMTGLSFGGALAISAGTTTLGSLDVSPTSLAVSGTGILTMGTAKLTVSGATTLAGTTSQINLKSGNVSLSTVSVTGGTFNGPTVTGVLTLSSTLNVSAGSFAMNTSTATASVSGATTLSGSGAITLSAASMNMTSVAISGGTFTSTSGTGTLTLSTTLSMTGGAFAGSTGRTTITGAASIAGTSTLLGASFDAGTSTLRFLGAVNVGGSNTLGTFHANGGLVSFEAITNMVAPDSLVVQGASGTTFDAAAGARLTFGTNAVAGTNAIDLVAGVMNLSTISTGTVTITAGNVVVGAGTTFTAAQVATTFPAVVTISGTVTGNTAAMTFSGAVTINSGGVFSGSSGARTFNGLLTLASGGTYTSSTGAHSFTAGVTTSGTFTITTAANTPTFTNTGLTVNGGTATFGAYGGNTVTLPTLAVGGGTFDIATNSTRLTVTGTSAFSGGTANLASASIVTLSGAVTETGATTLVSLGKASACAVTDTLGSTLSVSAGTFTVGNCAVTVTGAATVSAAGALNGGSSTNLRFANTLTLGAVTPTAGTLNVGSASVTVVGVFSLIGSSTFNGQTGSTDFQSSPSLTSGTFNVATAATTGKITFENNTTFGSGATLVFPATAGEITVFQGKTLTLSGPVTAATTSGGTKPKIDCTGCSASQGVGITFATGATLNIDGLELDNATAVGVTIQTGVTYTLLKNLAFRNNAGNGTSGTHLAITLDTAVINMPGCNFDTTATTNVTLNGTSGSPRGARAMFEFQSTTVNGSGSGEARDADGDSDGDNYGDNLAAPYYGSVVEWVNASPTDTTGTAEGFPTPAFDWNTFTWYGIYVAYRNTGGAGTSDVVWLRNNDGSPKYSFSVPQTSGDIVGTPYWDSVNEVTANVDVNGDGDKLDTDVRILYVGTSGGHIIKLIDSGSGLAKPTSGPWASDFTSGSVSTITSPLTLDATNIYFGGTSGTPKVFGVQHAGGANEATLQRTVDMVSTITTEPSWTVSGGTTYVFAGSTATSSQAYIYRINMTTQLVDASFSGVTHTVNGSMVLVRGVAYAATDGGKVHAIDALGTLTGSFQNVTGFPFQTAAAKPIKFSPNVDFFGGGIYFGDDGGNVYYLTSAGALGTGYPLAISASIKITSTPMYLQDGGVIAVGANDGYLYFIDRNNGTGPNLFKRFFMTSAGDVSSVAYNANLSAYMVSSSDGKLTFINGADVTDPTPGTR